MRKEIMQSLQQEYEQQRLQNAQEEARRRQEVLTRCPEIGQYLSARQELIFGGVRGILSGKAAADDLPARMDVMNKRIAALLRQNGFSADYLDPVYRCKQCRDTGYVGEPIREMCPCLRNAFYARLYREVGLGERAEQSFAAFDPNVFSDQPLPGKKYSRDDGSALDGAERSGENVPDACDGEAAAGTWLQCHAHQRVPISGCRPPRILLRQAGGDGHADGHRRADD